MTTCPDTGATQTVIHEDIATQANLAIDPPGTKISTASGGGIYMGSWIFACYINIISITPLR